MHINDGHLIDPLAAQIGHDFFHKKKYIHKPEIARQLPYVNKYFGYFLFERRVEERYGHGDYIFPGALTACARIQVVRLSFELQVEFAPVHLRIASRRKVRRQ